MLDSAYYQCNPPDRPAIPPKERTPMELFIRHVIYDLLTRNNIEKVHKLLRKLHWEEPLVRWPSRAWPLTVADTDAQVRRKLYNAFTKVWKIKYSHIQLLALLLFDLNKHHPDFGVQVVDSVLEGIKAGLEVCLGNGVQLHVAAEDRTDE